MPRPVPHYVTFEVDGRDISAPEGMMLVDAAKFGDVEIPYFCYEPKLGSPVGACRMCLVEIEGIPKLQTACSTPVKDGMVVTTTTDRVRSAQNAIVEFLLVNHPLDCPVCDAGGECPLQDISYGWGAGRSRFIEPKRHFKKPLSLSPLIAIDRERCILCFRCVRFSQEVAEDYQLVFLERADHTFVGTADGRPYVAPFSGNIIDLCPVGALTSSAYRFRARPWDIEFAGTVCTLCPSQCNVSLTTRDDHKVVRVQARDNHEVDDGWLCDKGRYGYQAFHAPERITQPMVRDGGALRPVSWDRAMDAAAAGLEKAGAGAAAIVGGEVTNEEGFLLQRLLREGLGSSHVDSRAGGALEPEHAQALSRPDLSARVSDIEYAGTVLVLDTELIEESPILELRVRKAMRRNRTRLVVAGARPGALDPAADAIVRFAPGAAEAALGALLAALGKTEPAEPTGTDDLPVDRGGIAEFGVESRQHGDPERHEEGSGSRALDGLARRAGTTPESLRNAAAALRGHGPIVVLWGERLSHGARGRQAVGALLSLARELGLADQDGGGLLEVPAGTNSRGLREVGCLPNLLPGLAAAGEGGTAGRAAPDIPGAVGDEVSALVLFGADPLRTHPDRAGWQAAIENANFVCAVADFESDTLREHADVVFPSESYAEKEGTVTHPDGRVQRLRQSVGHPGEVRPLWNVLVELSVRLGVPTEAVTSPMVTALMTAAVPFYAGLTLEELGGHGVRWQDREAAGALGAADLPEGELETPPELGDGLRLGTVPTLWAGSEVEHAPVLRFLSPRQRVELSPEDAHEHGVGPGDEVEVAVNGTSVRGEARLRHALPAGTVFLLEGAPDGPANALTNGVTPTVKLRRVGEGSAAGPEGGMAGETAGSVAPAGVGAEGDGALPGGREEGRA